MEALAWYQSVSQANNPQWIMTVQSQITGVCISMPTTTNAGRWMQLLSVRGFQKVNISIDQLLATADDGYESYVVETDTGYPDHLHDPHSDCPLAP